MYSVLLAAALTAGTAEVPQWHHGCHGCWGCHGCCGGNAFSYGCGGCCGGCWGCCGGCYGGVIIAPAPVVPVVPVHPHIHPHAAGLKATVLVKLPADATMYVDGIKADLTSGTRSFTTPVLTAGRDYVYNIRIEAVRDGETVQQTQRVALRANETSQVVFGEFEAVAKTAPKSPAKVVVKLPADAKLYVDGVLCPQSSPTRSFETPALTPGKTYAYTLKAEVVRDGQMKAETKRIEMVAGKEVNVDFGDLSAVQSAAR